MADSNELAHDYGIQLRGTLEEVWQQIDASGDYEGQDAREYLEEMVLEVDWEIGEPFAVVLTVGGPYAEITGGGRSQPAYTLDVYWGGATSRISGEAITRTGQYFRELMGEQ